MVREMPGSLQEPSEGRRAFRSNPDTGSGKEEGKEKKKRKEKLKNESPWNREPGLGIKLSNLRWWPELFLKSQGPKCHSGLRTAKLCNSYWDAVDLGIFPQKIKKSVVSRGICENRSLLPHLPSP